MPDHRDFPQIRSSESHKSAGALIANVLRVTIACEQDFTAVPQGQVHYWASVGKIATASAVMKLVEQGRLSLDDPISNYIEHVPNGESTSLRMLTNHTSGLFGANEDSQVRTNGAQLDLASVLEVINRQPPYACPGDRPNTALEKRTPDDAYLEPIQMTQAA